MSPRKADPHVRAALIEAAAKLLANQVPLSTRRLAKEVGTSPMAVYTRFGSMDELRREVRKVGFARFAAHLAQVPRTRDPVADLYMIGWAYAIFAFENPHLYRVMFIEPIPDAEVGWDALGQLLEGVTRCIDAGRFRTGDPWPMALHGWAMSHGLIMISFTRVFTPEEIVMQSPAITLDLFTGLGDTATAARRSIKTALRRIERDPAYTLPPLPDLTNAGDDTAAQA